MSKVELTDEELFNAVKLAKEIAERDGKPLEVAIKGAIEVMTEEKEKAMEASKPKEIAPIPETSIFMSDDDVAEFIAMNNERKDELLRDAHNLSRKSRDVIHTDYTIGYAKKGLYKQKAYEHKNEFFEHYILEDRQLTNDILQINTLAKENFYVYYRMSSADVIEKERLNMIEMYKQLKSMGNQTKQQVAAKKGWLSGMNRKVKDDLTIEENRGMHMIDGATQSEAYDTLYSFGKVVLKFDKERLDRGAYSERYFEETQQAVDVRIQELEGMSAEDFRAYRINQMQLTPEEITLYNRHVNEFMMSKGEKGRGGK